MPAHAAHMPRWAAPFAKPARYKTAYGGRSSGKTWAVARLLVLDAALHRRTVACCRQFQSSISVSAKPAMERAIHDLGLAGQFIIQEHALYGRNGSHIFFRGLERNREEIRGWESVDRVWVEEAQTLSKAAADILIPTIRKAGSEIWFTWNPHHRTDWVWQRFIVNPRPDDVVARVNWENNRWLSSEANDERLALQASDPGLYAHVWGGEPEDEGSVRRVLPWHMLRACVDMCTPARQQEYRGAWYEGGLDVADGGGNMNSFVARRGPVVDYVDQWRTGQGEGDVSAYRVDAYAREHGVHRVHYDAGGVGAGPATAWRMMVDRPYAVRPVKFGDAVAGPDMPFTRAVTNKMHFRYRNSQLAWAVRLRAERTARLARGDEAVDVAQCLLIAPQLPNLDAYMAQLAQPQWRESTNGKIEIAKVDESREVSPDMYDATVLAFAADSARGLRAR